MRVEIYGILITFVLIWCIVACCVSKINETKRTKVVFSSILFIRNIPLLKKSKYLAKIDLERPLYQIDGNLMMILLNYAELRQLLCASEKIEYVTTKTFQDPLPKTTPKILEK